MEYRVLERDELDKFMEIDRSEVIEHIYYYRDGRLELEEEFYDMKGFPPGEQEALLQRQYKIYDAGGTVIGCFNKGKLVGITSVENKLRGKTRNYIKMDVLFVSSSFRGHGVAKRLVELACEAARNFGGTKLYISATPSENTVNFYFSLGSRVAEEIDEELLKLEPEDIHLELPL